MQKNKLNVAAALESSRLIAEEKATGEKTPKSGLALVSLEGHKELSRMREELEQGLLEKMCLKACAPEKQEE